MNKLEQAKRDRHTPAVLAVSCPQPFCLAPVGEMCKSGMGNVTFPHTGRLVRSGEIGRRQPS